MDRRTNLENSEELIRTIRERRDREILRESKNAVSNDTAILMAILTTQSKILDIMEENQRKQQDFEDRLAAMAD